MTELQVKRTSSRGVAPKSGRKATCWDYVKEVLVPTRFAFKARAFRNAIYARSGRPHIATSACLLAGRTTGRSKQTRSNGQERAKFG